jgi:hypothetical protein
MNVTPRRGAGTDEQNQGDTPEQRKEWRNSVYAEMRGESRAQGELSITDG